MGITRKQDDNEQRWNEKLGIEDAESDQKAPKDDAKLYRCKLCGHEQHNARFCPKCLADTMKPV